MANSVLLSRNLRQEVRFPLRSLNWSTQYLAWPADLTSFGKGSARAPWEFEYTRWYFICHPILTPYPIRKEGSFIRLIKMSP